VNRGQSTNKRCRDRVGKLKENGNIVFKAGKYQEAVGLYTEAIRE
jgi:hypothetical protein